MQFRATVINRSRLWQLWFSGRRSGGEVSGVRFRRRGSEFVSVDDPLPPDAVAILANNSMIRLELITSPVGEAVPMVPVEPVTIIQPVSVPVDLYAQAPQPLSPKVDLRAPLPQRGWQGKRSMR